MSDSRKDLPSVNATNFLSRVRETLQGYLGTNGNVLDRGVTVRDLTDAGIVRVNPTYLSGGAGSPIVGAGPAVGAGGGTTTIVVPGGGSTTPPYVPDLTKPPAPTGFFAGAGLTNLQGGITAPAYTAGHGHDRSIVYGVSYGGSGPLPTFNDAVELTRFTGSIFAYPSTTATTWHLWVTHLSKDGVESDPTGGLNGLSVSTGQDIPLILAALSGQIGYTELSEDFTMAFDTVATAAGEAQGTANDAQNAATWLGNRYTVRTTVSVDGKTLVGGFGLAGTDSATQGASIDFGVSADRFWIGAPQQVGVTAVPSVKPFIVQTTDTVVNGVAVPKGVYMDAAYIVNLEAAVARLGTAWIGTAMMADASIVDAKIASLNAEKITAGLLAAERIDARGLTVKNESGDVLLDASGDTVPPWVVQVLGASDAGAVNLALPADAQNRARIRSLYVDNVNLKAKVSSSGNAIQLSSPSTEVYSATYGASTILLPDEYRELDHTRFTMEPNTYYRFTFTPICARAGVDTTVDFFTVAPTGAKGYLPDGTVFDAPGQFYQIGTRQALAASPSPAATPFTFYVRSGAAGGAIKFYAKANSEFYMLEWTRFAVHRLSEVVYPSSSVSRTGSVLAFATDKTSTPGFDTTGMPGAYDALWTVNTSRPMNSVSTQLVLFTNGVNAFFDPVKSRFRMFFELWSGPQDSGFHTTGPIILSPMVGSSAPISYTSNSGTVRQTNGLHGSYFAFDVAEMPPDEIPRWYFNVRFTSLTTPQDGVYNEWLASDDFARLPVVSATPLPPESVPIPPHWIDRYDDVNETTVATQPFLVGDRATSKTAYIEFEYFLDYLGEQIGSKRKVRIVINYTA